MASTASDSHRVVVGIGVMLAFAIIVTEVGGTSKGNADLIILVLLGLLILLGITHMANINGWASSNPWIPTTTNS